MDLKSTLYSGQAFRWIQDEERHRGFIDNVPVKVWAEDGRLVWQSAVPLMEGRIRHYFRLDASHDAFVRSAPNEPLLSNALQTFPGLRLLRQDPWESLVSFVLSQNSNETKIRSTIEKLCGLAGEPMELEGATLKRFPSPEALRRLDLASLRSTGMGYRAPYVQAVARQVAEGELVPADLPTMPYEEAFERLLRIPGIGEKVADCVLLYGCDHLQAFPTDVWVRRFLQESYYRPRRAATHQRLREFAWKKFGPQAGYAQHYLFHYRRVIGRLDESAE